MQYDSKYPVNLVCTFCMIVLIADMDARNRILKINFCGKTFWYVIMARLVKERYDFCQGCQMITLLCYKKKYKVYISTSRPCQRYLWSNY